MRVHLEIGLHSNLHDYHRNHLHQNQKIVLGLTGIHRQHHLLRHHHHQDLRYYQSHLDRYLPIHQDSLGNYHCHLQIHHHHRHHQDYHKYNHHLGRLGYLQNLLSLFHNYPLEYRSSHHYHHHHLLD